MNRVLTWRVEGPGFEFLPVLQVDNIQSSERGPTLPSEDKTSTWTLVKVSKEDQVELWVQHELGRNGVTTKHFNALLTSWRIYQQAPS